mmetsp:Transcript_58794/g.131054  ORF Transcript_58794/g.131054 Transcript_58794/m.131054 type:complete len:134 (-) Transcript_58794:596-997(-)
MLDYCVVVGAAYQHQRELAAATPPLQAAHSGNLPHLQWMLGSHQAQDDPDPDGERRVKWGRECAKTAMDFQGAMGSDEWRSSWGMKQCMPELMAWLPVSATLLTQPPASFSGSMLRLRKKVEARMLRLQPSSL